LLTIKPVGSMKSFFAEDEYTIDVKNCVDVVLYIQSMHPKLGLFMKQAQVLATFEDFCFLDKKGNIIDPQLFPYHKFKEDDLIYIAPVIVGAGGKTGTIVMIAVLVAVAIAAPQLLPGVVNIGGTALPAAMTGGAIFSGGITFSIGAIISNIAISLALSMVMSLFTATPKAKTREITKDSGTRSQNDAFGSLQNNTQAGTPVALNYGLMRCSGQFLSGYILSQQHAKNDAPSIASIFNANQSPLSAEAEEAA
tara:strand:- start:1951 stop:2706 length:756 start_codon:yes stop_codon:yes gene_type:complete